MKLTITKDVIDLFPDLAIGVVLAQQVDNKSYPQGLRVITKERVRELRALFEGKNFKEDPRIASWREAYRTMGVKPKKHPPTSEAYIKRAIKSDSLPEISAAVNAYLASELKYLLPIGGYDFTKLEGDLILCRADGSEEFEPLGGGRIEEVPAGEIVYKDDARTLTRRWNYRDADPTKITEETTDLILCTESVTSDYGIHYLQESVADIAELLRKFCRATIWTKVFCAYDENSINLGPAS